MTEPVEFTPEEREALRILAKHSMTPADMVDEELTRSTVLTGAQTAAVQKIVKQEIAAYFAAGETVLGEVVTVDGPREIARQEIASLAGKALRRTQDRNYTRSTERNMAIDVTNEEMAEFWGEVLAEYGTGPGPGEESGTT